jgi:hypothetical protein
MMAEDVWKLMANTFDYERRRCRKHFEEVCKRSSYQLIEHREKGELLGFIGCWNLGKWIVIEHLAVQKGENPYKIVPILLSILRNSVDNGVILIIEVDILKTDFVQRYKELYKLAGFIENPFVYIQPSYHKGEATFPQRIMSYPVPITYPQFKDLRSLLYRFVYGNKNIG